MARAQAIQPGFHLADQNAVAVAEICRRLEGLPLAIELAAGRSKVLTPAALLARLSSRPDLLSGGARDLPARQHTFRATLDWSYHSLTAAEQQLLARLAVFVGGWTLDAAEAICTGADDVGLAVLDDLQSLLDKSLVWQEPDADDVLRFRLWSRSATMPWSAWRPVAEPRPSATGTPRSILALAEAAAPQLTGPEQARWLDCLEAEQSNLRAALTWSWAAGGRPELGARGVAALWRFWYYRGHFAEWDRWLLAMRTAGQNLPPAAVATALVGRGIRALNECDFELAAALGEESLALSEQAGDRWGNAAALILTGAEGERPGTPGRVAEGLMLAREVGEPWLRAWALYNQGMELGWVQRDILQATAEMEASLLGARAAGDRWLISAVLVRLAQLALFHRPGEGHRPGRGGAHHPAGIGRHAGRHGRCSRSVK